MAQDKKGKKGQALKVKPETHRNRNRTKSRDAWTRETRLWARMDPYTRKLSQAILTFARQKGHKFSLPTPKIFTQDLDKQA